MVETVVLVAFMVFEGTGSVSLLPLSIPIMAPVKAMKLPEMVVTTGAVDPYLTIAIAVTPIITSEKNANRNRFPPLVASEFRNAVHPPNRSLLIL